MPDDRPRMLARRTITVAALGGVGAVLSRPDGQGRPSPPHDVASGRIAVSQADPGQVSAGQATTGQATTGQATTGQATTGHDAPGHDAPGQATTGSDLELPRGGRTLFPRYRLVGYCGAPGSAALGRLGTGSLARRGAEIERLGARLAAGRRPQPVFELIAVVAQSRPGAEGLYRARIDPEVIATYLAEARRRAALVLLNIQPGRASFLEEVRALEPWLRQPDVGLALDPEWAVSPGRRPGQVFGHMTWAQLDEVAAYVSAVVARERLPEKALVVHQLASRIMRGPVVVRRRSGVALIKSVDGIGTPAAKTSTWRRLVAGMPAAVHPGFKLFLGEDVRGASRLMTPAEVLALTPRPEYVLYE